MFKTKRFKLMLVSFIVLFVGSVLAWQIPKVFAAENIANNGSNIIISKNTIKTGPWRTEGNPLSLTACDPSKFHIDVNGGGLSPLTPTSCVIDGEHINLIFADDPWYHLALGSSGYSAANGLYYDAGAVTDSVPNTNIVVAHDASVNIDDQRAGWMVTATRNSDTEITVGFNARLMIVGDAGAGFTVADATNPQTTFAVSPSASAGDVWDNPLYPGGQTVITLTVADFSSAISNGVKVTYDSDPGNLASMMGGNAVETDSTGITIDSWAPPTMSSVVVDSNTQLTVTLSKLAASDTITKSNDGGFVVTGGNNTYEVTAVAPGATNAKVVLTVADMSASVTTGVTVTYVNWRDSNGNGRVTDSSGVELATDAVGVVAAEWTPPTLSSVVRDTDTQLTLTLSELAAANTITKSNDGGFVVTQTGSLTTFAVSAIAPGDTNDIVVLTVANMAAAEGAGVTVTYVKASALPGGGRNGTITDANGNYLATDSTGLIIAAWAEGRRGGTIITPTTTTTTTTTVPTTPVPEVTVTVPYGQTAETTVSDTGTTAAMSFGSAVSFPVAGAAVSVGVSGLANPAAGTAPVSIEVGTMSASRLIIQKMSAQGLKLDLELKVGEPQQIDVDGDGKMDLELLLEEVISVSDIKLTIKKLEVASTEDTTDETVVEPVAEINFYMDGRWVKLATSPTVYFIDKNNIRHVYINASIWESYFGKDYSKIELMPISELANYELGNSVPFKTGTLVKSPSSPKVYKVLDKGDVQWIKDESVANKYFGADWAKQIKDLTDALLATYNQVGILE